MNIAKERKIVRGDGGKTCDGSMNRGAVLELDRDGLVVQLHQEPAQRKQAYITHN